MLEVKAQAKFQRISPRKVRLVVGLLRNLSISQARSQLSSLQKGSASTVLKVLESAVANAVNNNKLSADNLVIIRAFVDGGPTLKRWTPRAFGRASAIRKRTSHITIVVGEKTGAKKTSASKGAAAEKALETTSAKEQKTGSLRASAKKSAPSKSSEKSKPAASKKALKQDTK